MEKKKVKSVLRKVLLLTIGIVAGYLLGTVIGVLFYKSFGSLSFVKILISLILGYLAFALNVILHEAGHMIMGLFTGYKFLSFRIFSLMLVKERNGKLRFRKFSIPGTLGQCLLIPPELDENGKIPVVLYNLGGVMMNVLLSIITGLILFLSPISGYFQIFIGLFFIFNIYSALTNGIPFNIGINNDAANMVELIKHPRTIQSLYRQLMVNALGTQGLMLSDMPKELFAMPEIEEMKSTLVSADGVLVENYYMEQMNHQSTIRIIDFLLDNKEIKLLDFYRICLEADRTMLQLILGEAVEIDKNFRKSLKQMSVLPNFLVVRYAIALLYDKDMKEADRLLKAFKKKIEKYPINSDKVTLSKLIEEITDKGQKAEA